MHKLITYISFGILAATSQRALQAEQRIGDWGAIAVQIDTETHATSNLLLNSDEVSDTILGLAPHLLYRANEGYASIDASIGINIQRYLENSAYDAEDFRSKFSIRLPDEPAGENYYLGLDLGYNEYSSADAFLQAINNRKELSARSELRYYLTSRLEWRTGVNFLNSKSEIESFSDIQRYSLPFAFYFDLDKSISVGAGYRFRDTETSGNTTTTSQDHAVFIGFENLRSELLSYELRTGYQIRNSETNLGDETDGGLFLEAEVTWLMTDRSQLSLKAGSDYDSTAANQSTETMYLNLGVSHRFDERWSARASIRAEDSNVTQTGISNVRQDEELSARISADFEMIPRRLKFAAYFRAADHSSTSSFANYSLIEGGLSCSYIY